MRAEYIGACWADAIRPALEAELAKILPSVSEATRRDFLTDALEAVDEYRKLIIPTLKDANHRQEKLDNLQKACAAFNTAVTALDPDTKTLLEQYQWLEIKDGAHWRIAPPPSSGSYAVPTFEQTEQAAAWAVVTQRAAARLAASNRRKGGAPRDPISFLVTRIALAYTNRFEAKPGKGDGRFFRLLEALSRATNLPTVGRTVIARVLKHLPETPRPAAYPRRGRPRTVAKNGTEPASHK